MPLVRILVDGYSLLHGWLELAPGKPRHSAHAREELVRVLTRYSDACGTPVTVVFDGQSPGGPAEIRSTSDVEILFSRTGQTADQMIERAAHLLGAYGEVLVVSDDGAERETVRSLGAATSNSFNFIQTVKAFLSDLDRDVKRHNERERNQFKKRPDHA